MPAVFILSLVIVVVLWILLSPLVLRWRRQRWQRRPFPAQWLPLLHQYVPIYPPSRQHSSSTYKGKSRCLAEKQFIGCGGLNVTDEMRVAIASVACLLLFHPYGDYFPALRSILVYPTAYWVNTTTTPIPYVVSEQREARLGESWNRDQVVLSWEQIQLDAQHWQDGRNLILHEFAHQLDQADGYAEGVPRLPSKVAYAQWAAVMTPYYQQFCNAVEQGSKTGLDHYGATNPAEFFAVVTETFFEKPRVLSRRYPGLYSLLQDYYQLDPMTWQ